MHPIGAQQFRKTGQVRIPLEQIRFWPGIRGGLGISFHHVHEIAWDCQANKTKLNPYGHVDLIEIPAEKLGECRDVNAKMCQSDKQLPRLSPEMKYVCVSKTHFCHAQKLAK